MTEICKNCGKKEREHYLDNPDGNIYCYTEITSKEDLIFNPQKGCGKKYKMFKDNLGFMTCGFVSDTGTIYLCSKCEVEGIVNKATNKAMGENQ